MMSSFRPGGAMSDSMSVTNPYLYSWVVSCSMVSVIYGLHSRASGRPRGRCRSCPSQHLGRPFAKLPIDVHHRHRSPHQVAESDLLEGALDGAIDAEHEAARGAGRADRAEGMAPLVMRLTVDEIPRAFQRRDQRAEGDRIDVAVERIAAPHPAVRADDLALVQCFQYFGDHRQRQLVERRDLARSHDLARLAGQIDAGKEAVIGEF